MSKRVLTGIKPTGQTHLGNYVGAIRPALKLSHENEESFLFLADAHSLTSFVSPSVLKDSVYQVASAWLALGLDPKKCFFYRQSDIPEIFELTWLLSTLSPKGLMNRAHSYKAIKEENKEKGKKDLDDKVSMGLYNYPILMAADILIFSADLVPVGKDQAQHLEITRDLAGKLNQKTKKPVVKIPKPFVLGDSLPGLDGRKMSKSYNNHIPLFLESKKLLKKVRQIKTDSTPANAPKDTKTCLIFEIYSHFASDEEKKDLKKRYQEGIAWGEAKDLLFEKLDIYFKEKKKIYEDFISNKERLDSILKEGASRAREISSLKLKEIKTVFY